MLCCVCFSFGDGGVEYYHMKMRIMLCCVMLLFDG